MKISKKSCCCLLVPLAVFRPAGHQALELRILLEIEKIDNIRKLKFKNHLTEYSKSQDLIIINYYSIDSIIHLEELEKLETTTQN